MTVRRGVSPSLLLALSLPHLAACGGVSYPEPAPAPAPKARAGEEDLRVLLAELGAQNVCGVLEGSFVQLISAGSAAEGDGEDDTSSDPPLGTGRLWVQSCSAEDVRGDLRIEIGGLGWQWIDRESRLLGATFEVEEYVRFRAALTVTGEVRPTYARGSKLLQLTLQPTDPIVASLHPIQPVDVHSIGIWSRLVAHILSALTGKGMDARGRELVEEQGTLELRMELEEGMAVAVDLCTGHRFSSIGALRAEALAERPPDVGGGRWITTERTQLHPGGLDIAGPWSTDPGDPLHGRVRARGGDVVAQLVCVDQVERLARAHLRREPLPRLEVLAEQIVTDGGEGRLQASTEGCDVALVVRPRNEQSTPVVVENVLWAPTASIPPTRRFLSCPRLDRTSGVRPSYRTAHPRPQ